MFRKFSAEKAENENAKQEEITEKVNKKLSDGILLGREISGNVVKISETRSEGRKSYN